MESCFLFTWKKEKQEVTKDIKREKTMKMKNKYENEGNFCPEFNRVYQNRIGKYLKLIFYYNYTVLKENTKSKSETVFPKKQEYMISNKGTQKD